jgi:hypothetical protein
MINSRIIFMILLVTFTLASCNREDSPEVVTRKFANHFALGEYDQAKQYGTESTIKQLEMMESLASIGVYLPDEENIEIISDKDVECEMTSDSTSICKYLEYGELVEIQLVKIDKKWFIDFPLDDYLNDDEWYEDAEDEEDDWEFDGTESQLN